MRSVLAFGVFLLIQTVDSARGNRRPFWQRLREDYKGLKSDECHHKFDASNDWCPYLCHNKTENPGKDRWSSCGGKVCNCDSKKCRKFGDCCLDVARFDDVPRVPDGAAVHQKCLRVPSSAVEGSEYIFMVNKCPANWMGARHKQLCEEDLDQSHPDLNVLLYTVPVHSKVTNNFYKNFHCAVCNRDQSNLTEWYFLSDNCPTLSSDIVSFDNVSYRNGTWTVPQRNRNCTFVIREFFQIHVYKHSLRARICHPNDFYVSTCSIRGSPHAKACYNYYAPVFTAFPSFAEQQHSGGFPLDRFRVYRNLHCLLCNLGRIPANETFYCRLPPSEHPSEGHPFIRPNLVMLLDVKSYGNESAEEGRPDSVAEPHPECKKDEIYLEGSGKCYKVHDAVKRKRSEGHRQKPKARPRGSAHRAKPTL